MSMSSSLAEASSPAPAHVPEARRRDAVKPSTAFGCPRDPLNHRYVYAVISSRARGLSLGVNLNPRRVCNYDCVYCEIDRGGEGAEEISVDSQRLSFELSEGLDLVLSGRIQSRPAYAHVPREMLALKQVAISGDGEPTLCPNFTEAVETVVHLRAGGCFPFFKLVLLTNGAGLQERDRLEALDLFGPRDEVWLKLDAGSPEHFQRINRAPCEFPAMIESVRRISQRRPVVIQTMMPSLDGRGPSGEEIQALGRTLHELKESGARITEVQVYSATRPSHRGHCGHLPLGSLTRAARRIREISGLRAAVY
ncbi:MAG: radical SAM protein [Verrucomicrobia bacterium]|nr:radical SAM protein [Verrucomicrobiota bacterium]